MTFSDKCGDFFEKFLKLPRNPTLKWKMPLNMFLIFVRTFNGKLIFSVFFSNSSQKRCSFLMAICWWHFIWKSDGKSYSARHFIAQKRCTQRKLNFLKWQQTTSKSLSKRWVVSVSWNWKLRNSIFMLWKINDKKCSCHQHYPFNFHSFSPTTLNRKNIVKVLLNILSIGEASQTFKLSMKVGEQQGAGKKECLIYWITNRHK